MDIAHYFDNPEELNKETLYELRNLIALYPFYQPARIINYVRRKAKRQHCSLQKKKHRQKQILTEQYRLLIISSNKFQTLRRKPRMVTESLHPSMQLWIMLPT